MSSYLEDFFDKRKQRKLSPEQAQATQDKALAEQREKAIAYKKFFGEPHHRAVMLDLMNRYFVLDPLPEGGSEFERGRAEGKRDVVLELCKRANLSIEQLDKILKGDFS